MRNRKLELDEALFTRMVKKRGYKALTDFYLDVNAEQGELRWNTR